MKASTMNRIMSPQSRERITKGMHRVGIPWMLLLAAAICIGISAACLVHAFNG